jgi:hypothetical protein
MRRRIFFHLKTLIKSFNCTVCRSNKLKWILIVIFLWLTSYFVMLTIHKPTLYLRKKIAVANTMPCKIPKVDPFSETMMKHFKPLKKVDCNMEPNWVYVHSGRVYLRSNISTDHPGTRCKITSILRKSETKSSLGEGGATVRQTIIINNITNNSN